MMENSDKPESIAAAAIRYLGEVYTLPAPAGHKEIMHDLRMKMDGAPGTKEKGYVTSVGRFVDMHEAMPIAKAADQIGSEGTMDPGDEFQLQTAHLWEGTR